MCYAFHPLRNIWTYTGDVASQFGHWGGGMSTHPTLGAIFSGRKPHTMHGNTYASSVVESTADGETFDASYPALPVSPSHICQVIVADRGLLMVFGEDHFTIPAQPTKFALLLDLNAANRTWAALPMPVHNLTDPVCGLATSATTGKQVVVVASASRISQTNPVSLMELTGSNWTWKTGQQSIF